MITEISDAQWAHIETIKQEWIEIGLSTDRVDRDDGTAGVKHAYRSAGLPEPDTVHWHDSPHAAAAHYQQLTGTDSWWRYIGGGCSAHWAAWVETHKYLGVTGLEPAEGRVHASRNTWWFWVLDGVAIACDRPTVIVGEQIAPAGWGSHQLHNEDGPAVAFADGHQLFSWHGLTVPEWVITDPTPERIATEPNVEIRRAAIEHLGWHNYLEGAKTVDDSGDEHVGVLHHPKEQPYDEDVRVLVARNGTDTVTGEPLWYGLTVPASCGTAAEAQRWLAGNADVVLERRT